MLFVCADHFRRRNSFRICFQRSACVCVCLSFLAVGSLSIPSFALFLMRLHIRCSFTPSLSLNPIRTATHVCISLVYCVLCAVPSVFVASALKFTKNNFFFYVINFCRLVAFLSVLLFFAGVVVVRCFIFPSFIVFSCLWIYSHMQAHPFVHMDIHTCMGVSRAQHINRMHGVNVNRKQQI